MYRTLGTRGSIFGVASGPYAGQERVVVFRRLSPAARGRLVDALAGRRQLAPVLRPARTMTSLTMPAAVGAVFAIFVLFVHGWPAAQHAPFAIGYVAGVLLLAALMRRKAAELSHEGTTISPGAYLFPLDVIEAKRDGTLHLIPLGGVREAAIAREGERHTLVLTFKDGTKRTFPVRNEREAENAYAALESAQRTLEKLTYGKDLADAVNLDPFFEVRVDDSWQNVSAPTTGEAPPRTALLFGLAALLGVGLFLAREALSLRVRQTQAARVEAEIAMLKAKARLAEQERETTEARRRGTSGSSDAPDPPPGTPEQAGTGLEAYQSLAPSSEMAAIMGELVARHERTGARLSVYFEHTVQPCGADPSCVPPSEVALAPMERRVVQAFGSVLSETLPRSTLPVDLSRARPAPPALYVQCSIASAGPGPQAIAMTFDATFNVEGHPGARKFRLTMPPPATPLTHTRDRSLFALGDRPRDADLVYARGMDRLYDEIYGLFFSGAPRVPLPGTEREDLDRTFGTP